MIEASEAARALPLGLRDDARDAHLPGAPGAGFRNMGCPADAHDDDRWAGYRDCDDAAPALAALADRMMRVRPGAGEGFEAGYTYLAQFAAHDMQFSTKLEAQVQPVSRRPLRFSRLMLETIYGEGPEEEPEFYGFGAGDLAPWRLKVGVYGPGVPPGQRTLSWRAARRPMPGEPAAHLVAADEENDQNPVVAQLAGLAMRLHNVALTRLARHPVGPARFAAAQRVARAALRGVIFGDLLPRLLRQDVLAVAERAPLDRHGDSSDDLPVELTHVALRCGHALVRSDYALSGRVNDGRAINVADMLQHSVRRNPGAFAEGRLWPLDWPHFIGPQAQRAQGIGPHVNCFFAQAPGLRDVDHPRLRRAELIQRDLESCLRSGAQRIEALARLLTPSLGALPGAADWLLFDAAARRRAVLQWIAEDSKLRPFADCLANDPPLYLFLLLEAAAPEAQGGGAGRRFGALGAAIIGDAFHAARRATAHLVEDAPQTPKDLAAMFGPEGAPRDLAGLVAHLTH